MHGWKLGVFVCGGDLGERVLGTRRGGVKLGGKREFFVKEKTPFARGSYEEFEKQGRKNG